MRSLHSINVPMGKVQRLKTEDQGHLPSGESSCQRCCWELRCPTELDGWVQTGSLADRVTFWATFVAWLILSFRWNQNDPNWPKMTLNYVSKWTVKDRKGLERTEKDRNRPKLTETDRNWVLIKNYKECNDKLFDQKSPKWQKNQNGQKWPRMT